MPSLVSLITPINIKEEREKFFSSKKYNPIFSYSWKESENTKFSNKIKTDLFYAIKSQDNSKIVDLAKKLFHTNIDDNTLNIAKTFSKRSQLFKKKILRN